MKSKAQDIGISNIKTRKGRVVDSWYTFFEQNQVEESRQESRQNKAVTAFSRSNKKDCAFLLVL